MSHEALGRQFHEKPEVYGLVAHFPGNVKRAYRSRPGMTVDHPEHIAAVKTLLGHGADVTTHFDHESLARAAKGVKVEEGTSDAVVNLISRTAKSSTFGQPPGSTPGTINLRIPHDIRD